MKKHNLTFGEVLDLFQKGMFPFLAKENAFKVNRHNLLCSYSKESKIKYNSYIDIIKENNSISVLTPNQLDILSEDLMIIE